VLPDPVLVLLPVVLELPGLAVPLEVPLEPAPLFAAPPPPAAPPPAPPPPPPWASAAVLIRRGRSRSSCRSGRAVVAHPAFGTTMTSMWSPMGVVVGRVFKAEAAPAGMPWMFPERLQPELLCPRAGRACTEKIGRGRCRSSVHHPRSNCPAIAEATGAITSSCLRGTSPRPRFRPWLLSRRHLGAIRQRPQHRRVGPQR
jgi:hypothetical protein